jgi:hypothetical protein
VAAPDLPNFDPRVIERFAESAYRKANAIFTGCVAGGVVLGALFGATPLTPLGAHWPIPPAFGFATTLLGAVVGGVIGYVVGDTRSALCRLQGQTALAQVESAKHARAMADAMREIHEIHEQIRELTLPAAAPAPEPESVPEPSPFNLPSLPALRVANSGPQVKPPPLSPPS